MEQTSEKEMETSKNESECNGVLESNSTENIDTLKNNVEYLKKVKNMKDEDICLNKTEILANCMESVQLMIKLQNHVTAQRIQNLLKAEKIEKDLEYFKKVEEESKDDEFKKILSDARKTISSFSKICYGEQGQKHQ